MALIGRRTFIAGSAAASAMTGAPSRSRAQSDGWHPDRPVRFVVPLAAGGALDFVARQCADVTSRLIGQQCIVENRTGAGGTIGMDTVMRADADGYTVLIANDNVASAPHILKLPYDYTKVLAPVLHVSNQPLVLGVHPSLGVGSLREFIAKAKQTGAIGFASSGVGSNQHVLGAWIAREAGIRLDHIPYRGAGQAVNDLTAGHVKAGLLGPTALLPHHEVGTIRIIAQSGGRRAPTLPDIPTIDEAGLKGVVLDAWFGVFLPAAATASLVGGMNAVMGRALQDARLRDAFAKGIVEPAGGTPDQLGVLARADSAKYERLVRELGITGG